MSPPAQGSPSLPHQRARGPRRCKEPACCSAGRDAAFAGLLGMPHSSAALRCCEAAQCCGGSSALHWTQQEGCATEGAARTPYFTRDNSRNTRCHATRARGLYRCRLLSVLIMYLSSLRARCLERACCTCLAGDAAISMPNAGQNKVRLSNYLFPGTYRSTFAGSTVSFALCRDLKSPAQVGPALLRGPCSLANV